RAQIIPILRKERESKNRRLKNNGEDGRRHQTKEAAGTHVLEHSKKAKSIRAQSFTRSAQKAQLVSPGYNS
ncbi:MAG: hypothetical protein WAM14_17610, partial [Candidatus Nitrosopolaris sp.]